MKAQTISANRGWRVIANLGKADQYEIEDFFLRPRRTARCPRVLCFGAKTSLLAGGIGYLMQKDGIGKAANNLMPGKSPGEYCDAVIINDRLWRRQLLHEGHAPQEINAAANRMLAKVTEIPSMTPIVCLSLDPGVPLQEREGYLLAQLNAIKSFLDPEARLQREKEFRVVWAIPGNEFGIAPGSIGDFFYGLRKDVFQAGGEDRVLTYSSTVDWFAAEKIIKGCHSQVDGLYLHPTANYLCGELQELIALAEAAEQPSLSDSRFFDREREPYLLEHFGFSFDPLVGTIGREFNLGNSEIQSLLRIPTEGSFPHKVFSLLLKTDKGSRRYYLKKTNADVEMYGQKFLSFSGLSLHQIRQLGEWLVSEEVPGRLPSELPRTVAIAATIGEAMGRYAVSAYAFAMIERDNDGKNIIYDEARRKCGVIDLEVILTPRHADFSNIGEDIANVLRLTGHHQQFFAAMEQGFIDGCEALKTNEAEARALVSQAFGKRLKIGFTGHEPGIGGLTGDRKPIIPEDEEEIMQRITFLTSGTEQLKAGIYSQILLQIKKELREP